MINAKDVDTAGGLLHVRVTEIYIRQAIWILFF